MAKQRRGHEEHGADMRRKCLEMRKAGATYAQIGDALNCSPQNAAKHVKKALDEIAKKTAEDATEIIQLELERLDTMLLGLFKSAKSGNEHSVDRVLKIMERRARLLGLDAPKRVLDESERDMTVRVVYDD